MSEVKKRYLTKSRFKLGWSCARKLVYADDPQFLDNRSGDDFLKMLAEGGFQVGEYAKLQFGPGIEVEETANLAAVERTRQLIESGEKVIFEAALMYESCLVRVDILRIGPTEVEVLEVKAKKEPKQEEGFLTKKGEVRGNWEEYLIDVAFQTWVAEKVFPKKTVTPYLVLISREQPATIDGLNQKFPISEKNGRMRCSMLPGLQKKDLGAEILVTHQVRDIVDRYFRSQDEDGQTFNDRIRDLLEVVDRRSTPAPKLSKDCKSCEFFGDSVGEGSSRNGGAECWAQHFGGKPVDYTTSPLAIELWNTNRTFAAFVKNGPFLRDLDPSILKGAKEGERKAPTDFDTFEGDERKWMQIEAAKGETSFALRRGALQMQMSDWKYPLHLIDFETASPALPFFKEMGAYESIAFQFSHHVLHQDGRIEHRTEYLDATPGKFPSVQFLRALRAAVGDTGTVFRYADHENTIVRSICELLKLRPSLAESLAEAKELIEFGESLLKDQRRAMFDLLKLVKDVYYSPRMGGSNSIKVVLPSVLTDSKNLAERFSKPIYGTSEIPSFNFKNWNVVERDESGLVKDPYKRLGKIISKSHENTNSSAAGLVRLEEVNNGALAMVAYNELQFAAVSQDTRAAVESALKRYCELDTLSMVLIIEFFRENVRSL